MLRTIKQFLKNNKRIALLFFLISPVSIYAQSLFENALGENLANTPKYQLGGYIRSDLYANENKIREKYAEGALKLEIKGNKYGNAYAEMRYRGSTENDNEFWLREGYVNLYFGKFDFRIGEQVIMWGRADGFNPTNNLTPTDLTVFSPEEDDKRLANFVVKMVYNFYPLKIEVDWIPAYKASELPFEKATLPENVNWSEENPEQKWDNSSIGLKLTMEKPAFDGSLSYFNGYHKMPGLNCSLSENSDVVFTQPYKVQVWGADFSTTAGNYGLRGEFAYSMPNNTTDELFSIPCDQLEYTLGIDREWGNFSLILQYVGKYIFDFDKKTNLENPLSQNIQQWNHMLFSQQEEWNHSVSIRPELDLFHETLTGEMLGLANFSTEEIMMLPKVTYTISDALELCAGAQLFFGPDDTLYGFMQDKRNAGFIEIKLSF